MSINLVLYGHANCYDCQFRGLRQTPTRVTDEVLEIDAKNGKRAALKAYLDWANNSAHTQSVKEFVRRHRGYHWGAK